MPDFFTIFLTSSLTILGGVTVFVVGQIAVKFIIEPLHEQSQLVGEITNSLIYYANAGSSGIQSLLFEDFRKALNQNDLEEPARQIIIERCEELLKDEWKKSREASRLLREQASQLMGKTNAIKLYWLWEFLRFVPRQKDVITASQELIGLSNEDFKGDTKHTKVIGKCLRVKILVERFGK